MARAVVIADDLTGAADTALPFWSHGLAATVAWADTAVDLPEHAEVVALSTETRGRTEAAAGRILGRLGRRLAPLLRTAGAAAAPLPFKKIDSTLRGWVGAEVGALLDHLPGYTAWVIPSYPKLGRRMEAGVYTVQGTPLACTAFAHDVSGCPADSRVVPLLEAQLKERVGFVPAGVLDDGSGAVAACVRRQVGADRKTRVVAFDAATDEHIRRIVAEGALAVAEGVSSGLPPILWVGSAGLAGGLAAHLAPGKGAAASDDQFVAPSSVIVAAGSRNPVTLRQVAFLKERVRVYQRMVSAGATLSPGDVTPPPLEAEDALGPVLLTLPDVAAADPPAPTAASQRAAASRLGAAAARALTQALARGGSRGLVLTGGEIAAATCRHLGVRSLEIIGQVEEGMPLLRLRGGPADGTLAVTKAGGFGDEESLYRAWKRLAGAEEGRGRGHAVG
jgi:uncharacterized protein YgbK (DUF1537 family)